MARNIRRATSKDIEQLQIFFKIAYGEKTIFQDATFLLWFFGGEAAFDRDPSEEVMLNSMIAVDASGRVHAHYGYLHSSLAYQQNVYPLLWGVNAFTLPEFRCEGIGRDLVAAVEDQCTVFGVIGFTSKTADFYQSLGFNVFAKQRYQNNVLVLNPAIQEIMALIGTNSAPAATQILDAARSSTDTAAEFNFSNQTCGTDQFPDSWKGQGHAAFAGVLTPVRSRAWLDWRYAPASGIDYQKVFSGGYTRGKAVLVARSIKLPPTNYVITRIVDLFGDEEAAESLLRQTCATARAKGHLYVEFPSFGKIYGGMLERLKFICLTDDAYATLPSLTNPVGYRVNDEYVGLRSAKIGSLIANLSLADTYLTSTDSDRDRRGTIA